MEKLAVIDVNRHVIRVVVGTVSQRAYAILYEEKSPIPYPPREQLLYGTLTLSQQACITELLLAEKKRLEASGVRFIVVAATSFLREVRDAHAVVTDMRRQTGLHVEIIPDRVEAQAIYCGVDLRLHGHRFVQLLLDTNGPSMEFVLCKGTHACLEETYPTCMQEVVDRFPHKDPMASQEIKTAKRYFRFLCLSLFRLYGGCTVDKLVGHSGIFQTLFELHKQVNKQPKVAYYPNMKRMSAAHFRQTYRAILQTPADVWRKNRAIDPLFLPMMPLSAIFLNELVKCCEIDEIVVPPHSLQTGLFVHLWRKLRKYRILAS